MNHPSVRCVLAGLILGVIAILPEAGRGWTPVIAISAPAIVAGLSVVPGRLFQLCLLYTSPSPRDKRQSRMPSSA